MALGINTILLGSEFLVVEKFELSPTVQKIATKVKKPELNSTENKSMFRNTNYQYALPKPVTSKSYFQPKEWMPWSMLAAGAVIVIYTSTFSKRRAENQKYDE